MYNIANKFDNAIDVLAYTLSAMKDSGFMPADIDDFLNNAIGKGNFNLLIKSKEMIEECNKVVKLNTPTYSNNWRDYYYGKGEDELLGYFDDEYEDDNDVIPVDCCQFELAPNESYVDDDEAYEGFDSCTNHFYNAYEDDEDYDEYDSISSNYLANIPYKCY